MSLAANRHSVNVKAGWNFPSCLWQQLLLQSHVLVLVFDLCFNFSLLAAAFGCLSMFVDDRIPRAAEKKASDWTSSRWMSVTFTPEFQLQLEVFAVVKLNLMS